MARSPFGRGALFGAAMSGLFVLLASLALLPYLRWTTFLAPLPIAWEFAKHGPKAGINVAAWGGVAYISAVSSFAGWAFPLAIALPLGIVPGLAIGAGLYYRLPASSAYVAGAVASVGFAVLLIAGVTGLTGMNLPSTLASAIRHLKPDSVPPALVMGGQNLSAETMAEMMRILFPSLLSLFLALHTGVSFLLVQLVLSRSGGPILPMAPFGTWRLPRLLVWFWIMGFLATQMGGYWGNLGLNIMALFMWVYTVQGLSVAYFYLSRRGPRALIALMLGGALLMPLVSWALGLLGMVDGIFDLRRLGLQEDNQDRN